MLQTFESIRLIRCSAESSHENISNAHERTYVRTYAHTYAKVRIYMCSEVVCVFNVLCTCMYPFCADARSLHNSWIASAYVGTCQRFVTQVSN